MGWGKLAMTSSMVEYFILMLGGPECLFALLEKKRVWSGGQRNVSLARGL
jgi:hypothetical protein